MEQFSQFFADIGRIAAALETFVLLQGGDPEGAAVVRAPQATSVEHGVAGSAPAPTAEAKRKRRTKEQIAADEAAASAAAASAVGNVLGNAPVPATPPAMPPFPPVTAAAPVAAPFQAPTAPPAAVPGAMAEGFNPAAAFAAPPAPASIVVTPPPVTAPPAPAQQAVDMSAYEAQHNTLAVPQQFAALLDVFTKYGNHAPVRDALGAALGALNVGMPLSDPLDRAQPGEQYKALTNAQRWGIYRTVFSAATAVTQQM